MSYEFVSNHLFLLSSSLLLKLNLSDKKKKNSTKKQKHPFLVYLFIFFFLTRKYKLLFDQIYFQKMLQAKLFILISCRYDAASQCQVHGWSNDKSNVGLCLELLLRKEEEQQQQQFCPVVVVIVGKSGMEEGKKTATGRLAEYCHCCCCFQFRISFLGNLHHLHCLSN